MKNIIIITLLLSSIGCASYHKTVANKHVEKNISQSGEISEQYFVTIEIKATHYRIKGVPKKEYDKINIGDNVGLY